jgi:hypothetical protein
MSNFPPEKISEGNGNDGNPHQTPESFNKNKKKRSPFFHFLDSNLFLFAILFIAVFGGLVVFYLKANNLNLLNLSANLNLSSAATTTSPCYLEILVSEIDSGNDSSLLTLSFSRLINEDISYLIRPYLADEPSPFYLEVRNAAKQVLGRYEVWSSRILILDGVGSKAGGFALLPRSQSSYYLPFRRDIDSIWIYGGSRPAAMTLPFPADKVSDNCSYPSAADITPPRISLISPAEGTTVLKTKTVTFTAAVTDNVGVSRVEFYEGNNLLKYYTTATPSSYTRTFSDEERNSLFKLTIKAYDAAGNVATREFNYTLDFPTQPTTRLEPNKTYFLLSSETDGGDYWYNIPSDAKNFVTFSKDVSVVSPMWAYPDEFMRANAWPYK